MAVKNDTQYAEDISKAAQQVRYVPSQGVADAQAELEAVSQGKPQHYQSADAERLQGLYDDIINREAYSYDPSKDTAYGQYRQAYEAWTKRGADAAQDATKAMSGGYGSAWSAQAAGQQYGEGLKSMNDVLPQYEQNAYRQYQAEGDLMQTKLDTAIAKDETDYQRWSDDYSRWQNDRDYAASRADTAYANDYQLYTDNINNALKMIGYGREDAETVRSNAYTMAMTLLKKGVMPIDTLLTSAGISKEDALAYAKKNGYSTGGGHSSGRRGTGTRSDPYWYIAGDRSARKWIREKEAQ